MPKLWYNFGANESTTFRFELKTQVLHSIKPAEAGYYILSRLNFISQDNKQTY